MTKVADAIARMAQTVSKINRVAPTFTRSDLMDAVSKAGPTMVVAASMRDAMRRQLEDDMTSYGIFGKTFDAHLMEYDDTLPYKRSFLSIMSVAQNTFDRALDMVGNPKPDESPANIIHIMGLATQLWTGCRAIEDHIHDWDVGRDLDSCLEALMDEHRNVERTLAVFGRDSRTRPRDVARSLAARFQHDIQHAINIERALRDIVGVDGQPPERFWHTYEGFGGEQLHELMQAGFNAGLALEAVFEERAFATG